MVSIAPLHFASRALPWSRACLLPMVMLVALCTHAHMGAAQTFDSGSTGADGALNLATPGTIIFDPVALGLDPEGDNIFHFTTIAIAPGVTVRLTAQQLNGPIVWLASGAVEINGVVDLNGEDGHAAVNEPRFPPLPGAGGFGGGIGGTATSPAQGGFGPGGGRVTGCNGGSGGYAINGANGSGAPGDGGPAYGNAFLVPLVGGSGGAGGPFIPGFGNGAGGGAGGGALLVASSMTMTVNGTIQANGGKSRGAAFCVGGSGSGGAIYLAAPVINGTGTLSALGGTFGPATLMASYGRIRLEAFQRQFTGSISPLAILTTPFRLFLTPTSSLRVVSIAGVPVPPNPTGSFTMPDVTIDEDTAVDIEIEAHNVPPGTVVQLYLFSENEADQIVDAPPLVGTPAQSTAIASVVIPSGFSRGFVRALWVP